MLEKEKEFANLMTKDHKYDEDEKVNEDKKIKVYKKRQLNLTTENDSENNMEYEDFRKKNLTIKHQDSMSSIMSGTFKKGRPTKIKIYYY